MLNKDLPALPPLLLRGLGPSQTPRTKAEILDYLDGRIQHAAIPKFIYFSVCDWESRPSILLDRISEEFRGSRVAVRSSTGDEDSNLTLAGHYRSRLKVPSGRDTVSTAITEIVESFRGSPRDQILIQEMVEQPEWSGVLLNRDLNSGAPYYAIDYDDSGRTDGVTSGAANHKSVLIHESAREVPARFRALLEMARELEALWPGKPLNVEFAIRHGKLYILQVRLVPAIPRWTRARISRHAALLEELAVGVDCNRRSRAGLAGRGTILGQMPDWNPAELLGPRPGGLALSLFGYLISDRVWQQARALMGYRPVPGQALLMVLAGQPYVDVRKSFNSFLPAGLSAQLEEAVVDAWLQRLEEHPQLHDKVEFEVAQTVLDFSFRQHWRQWYPDILSPTDLTRYENALRNLTRRSLGLGPESTLRWAMQRIRRLERIQSDEGGISNHTEGLDRALGLLLECRRWGTLPFAVIARHAFMAESLWRSAVERGAIRAERVSQFKRSLSTVATRVSCDLSAAGRGAISFADFLRRHGHLRPGTFDILSPRYDQRAHLRDCLAPVAAPFSCRGRPFQLREKEAKALERLLRESGLAFSASRLLAYASSSWTAREHAKYVFSRHLSNALESLAHWGERRQLSRSDLFFLELQEFSADSASSDSARLLRERADARRRLAGEESGIQLGSLVRDGHDLRVVDRHDSTPNFITSRVATGPALRLERRFREPPELRDKVVCIESADPGFDWIFAGGIGGLVTRFGGANSHMAIRCAEMEIPAAIGVGDLLFTHLTAAAAIELNCPRKLVRPLQ